MKAGFPSLRAMRAFESAARHCNFAQAGRELHLSSAAVSQQVKALESWLGVALFERSHNALELTEAGKNLLPGFSQAFRTLSDSIAEVRDDVTQRSVRIAGFPNFIMNWLLPRLPTMLKQMPDIEIELLVNLDPFAPLFDQADLMVRVYDSLPDADYDYLFSARLYPVAGERLSYLAPQVALDPTVLLAHPLLFLKHSPDDWASWFAAAKGIDVQPSAALWFDSQAVMMEAVRQGLGIALARSPFDDRDVELGRVTVLDRGHVDCQQSWYLVSPSAMRQGRANRVKNWILEQARLCQNS